MSSTMSDTTNPKVENVETHSENRDTMMSGSSKVKKSGPSVMVHMRSETASRAKPDVLRFVPGDEVPTDIRVWCRHPMHFVASDKGTFAMCECDTCVEKSTDGIRFSWTKLLEHLDVPLVLCPETECACYIPGMKTCIMSHLEVCHERRYNEIMSAVEQKPEAKYRIEIRADGTTYDLTFNEATSGFRQRRLAKQAAKASSSTTKESKPLPSSPWPTPGESRPQSRTETSTPAPVTMTTAPPRQAAKPAAAPAAAPAAVPAPAAAAPAPAVAAAAPAPEVLTSQNLYNDELALFKLDVELAIAELSKAQLENNAAEVKKQTVAVKIAQLKLTKAQVSAKREDDTLSERSAAPSERSAAHSERSAAHSERSAAPSTRSAAPSTRGAVPDEPAEPGWKPVMPIFLEVDCDNDDCEGRCGKNHNQLGVEGRDGYFLPADVVVPDGYCPDDRVPERCRDYDCPHDHARGRVAAMRKHSTERYDNRYDRRSNERYNNRYERYDRYSDYSDYRSSYRNEPSTDRRTDRRNNYKDYKYDQNEERKHLDRFMSKPAYNSITKEDLLELILSRRR